MPRLQYPEPDFRISTRNGKEVIFDSVRRKWVALTPEEWVRQHLLHYLVKVAHYPSSLIAVEKEWPLGELSKRFDILVYDRQHRPWMIIECKENREALSESVFRQVLRYHTALPVPYLVISNGSDCYLWERKGNELLVLEQFPVFPPVDKEETDSASVEKYKTMDMDPIVKHALFDRCTAQLAENGLRVISSDRERPWGGFLVIDEAQAADFMRLYFPDLDISTFAGAARLSPKLLLVAPGRRLSWQYHFRRAEVWRCLEGPVQVVTSEDDTEREIRTLQPGESIRLRQGERHRLTGMEYWGVVAEIWQHIRADHPSDEEDIVRLQDDFGR